MKVLRLERKPEKKIPNDIMIAIGYWQIWIHHDRQLTQGTFLRLYDNGSIEQVTSDGDGVESIIRIKDEDK